MTSRTASSHLGPPSGPNDSNEKSDCGPAPARLGARPNVGPQETRYGWRAVWVRRQSTHAEGAEEGAMAVAVKGALELA